MHVFAAGFPHKSKDCENTFSCYSEIYVWYGYFFSRKSLNFLWKVGEIFYAAKEKLFLWGEV